MDTPSNGLPEPDPEPVYTRTIKTHIHLQPQPLNVSPHSVDSAHSRLRRAASKSTTSSKRAVSSKVPTKLKVAPSASLKPLVPKNERKHQENDIHARIRKKSDAERLVADGACESPQRRRGLSVSNVGNNGKIYLRPIVRPANQRYFTQPNMPTTTLPTTAVVDTTMVPDASQPAGESGDANIPTQPRKPQLCVSNIEKSSDLHLSQWETPSPTIIAPNQPLMGSSPDVDIQANPSTVKTIQGRRRAASDAARYDAPALPSLTISPDYGTSGALKIVISQSHTSSHDQENNKENTRPRTAGQTDALPFIDVPIPSPRIGQPRFTVRGTPVLRVSDYTATEDLHSSIAHTLSAIPTPLPRSSYVAQSLMSPSIHGASREPTWMMVQTPRRFLPSMPTIPMLTVTPVKISQSEPTTPMPRVSIDQEPPITAAAVGPVHVTAREEVGPAMFDALTFKPACDDGNLVRYSPSGAIMAATPPRLIAEITSPCILDYELLSDFFLTFRAFLEPLDLVCMLVSRFHWAADRNDEIGMVVRVRTFVALRHWILNYFVDDFIPNLELRVSFCNLVNELSSNLVKIGKDVRPHLKIVNELKKCWRRVCAQFWDGDDDSISTSSGTDPDITPGGIAGHRDMNINPAYWEQKPILRPSIDNTRGELENNPSIASVIQGSSNNNGRSPVESVKSIPQHPTSHDNGHRHGANPLSVSSIDVASCTFPTVKNLHKFGFTGSSSSQAHSARPATAHNIAPSGGIASAPKNIVGKRVRPHKRNASLSDSLRDHTEPPTRPTDNMESHPVLGSLVRGDLFPPSQALVEAGHSSDEADNMRWSTMDSESNVTSNNRHYASGPGVKKIFDTVKRALSTTRCPITGLRLARQQLRVSRLLSNPAPSSGVVPLLKPKKFDENLAVRVDLLGAAIADAFKSAVRDEQTGAGSQNGLSLQESALGWQDTEEQYRAPTYASAHLDTSFDGMSTHSGTSYRRTAHKRVLSDGAITSGSKSIMIINDTRHEPFDLSTLPIHIGSTMPSGPPAERFTEALTHVGDLTPPSTPPDHLHEVPQQTSHMPNHSFFVRPDDVHTIIPPFVPDLQSFLNGGCLSPNQAFRSPQTATFPRAIAIGTDPSYTNSSLPLPQQAETKDEGDTHGEVETCQEYSASRHLSRADDSIVASTVTQSHRHSTMSGADQPHTSFHSSHHRAHRRSVSASSFASSASPEIGDKAQPARMLRRRPAGNLREVSTVNDLDQHLSMFRSRSMTTIDTFTDSIRSSYRISYNEGPSLSQHKPYHEAVSPSVSEPIPHTVPFGSPTSPQQPSFKKLSLFSTHSSMHHPMRSSFEAELRKLAAIPDDVDDGVEIALMKLEGRYEKPATFTELTPAPPRLRKKRVSLSQLVTGNRTIIDTERRQNRQASLTGQGSIVSPVMNMTGLSLEAVNIPGSPLCNSFLPAGPMPRYEADTVHFSDDSSSKNPSQSLCSQERESLASFNNEGSLENHDRDWAKQAAYISDDGSTARSHDLTSVLNPALCHAMPIGSDAKHEDSICQPKIRISGSFLDSNSYNERITRDSLDGGVSPATSDYLGHMDKHGSPRLGENDNSSSHIAPPSPPMTLEQALNIPSSPEQSPKVQVPPVPVNFTSSIIDMQLSPFTMYKPLPPTPEATPTTTHSHTAEYPSARPSQESPVSGAVATEGQTNKEGVVASQRAASHLPFILAFDSDVLAQQFTLIEKEALIEIDWRELVEMGWKTSTNGLWRSWLDFLRNSDSRGIDVVVARFNIMVKWAVSEIVLTQNINERARCIIKLIHIAKHCRRYRNFASLAQITMALTSPEVTRLAQTWALVPAAEVSVVRSLETLMTPTRNFYNIRSEMETGSDKGCVPFIGIYMHDLTYNSQRPAHVPASSQTAGPLVNFERYRRTAAVVKTLLRLFEASALYDFQPVEGITERCLWVCALHDEEIRSRASQLV
ncbi:Guanine nucleotide exchange factor lte1 [Ceratocystis pirilliformis]|uniref:Guanine nucleotide exchange factor lte1 n=1 Tax=Ceratocystis pirilliformis TaxID=259994 RepID=A0ABR3YXE5_9PEZI